MSTSKDLIDRREIGARIDGSRVTLRFPIPRDNGPPIVAIAFFHDITRQFIARLPRTCRGLERSLRYLRDCTDLTDREAETISAVDMIAIDKLISKSERITA